MRGVKYMKMDSISEIYKKLYHYTTWSGVLGIIKSQSLWATHHKFLNDCSELALFREKLAHLLIPHITTTYERLMVEDPKIKEKIIALYGCAEKAANYEAHFFINGMYEAIGEEIYILSFCGHNTDPYINENGLLSQWRGYGIDGGVLLVFDTKEIEQFLKKEFSIFQYNIGHLSDVIYSDNDEQFKTELKEEISNIFKDWQNIFSIEQAINNSVRPKPNCYESFVKCMSRFKHVGFKEENEVRLAALPTILNEKELQNEIEGNVQFKSEKEIKYRESNGLIVPYVDLLASTDIELPIEKIIIGPHKEKQLRASTLKTMLNKKKIEISCSDIPYIGN